VTELGSEPNLDPSASIGPNVTIHPGAVFGADVVIGEGVEIASGAVIRTGATLGAGCVVEEGALLGKRPRLRRGSSAAGEVGELEVADEVVICAGAIVYAGARIGRQTIIGDQAQVRERAIVGAGSVVGRGSCVDFDAVVGDRVLIQTGVYVTGAARVEDDVFIGPGALMTNDNTMGRHPGGGLIAGPVLRRACRVGGGAVLLPGVEIGEEAFVAAGSVVTRDVGAREVVMGSPARAVREVPDADLLERWR
jgi:UDP-3-O-[3-hydroxymyristoyl] glucosamine N-acyltransferase